MPRKTRKQKMRRQEREKKKRNLVARKEFIFPVCCIRCYKIIDTLTGANMVIEYPTGEDAIAKINGESKGYLCKECVRQVFVLGAPWTYIDYKELFKEEEQPNAASIRDAVAEDSKRFSDKYCCSIRDINKEEIK